MAPIDRLHDDEAAQLFRELNYLNMGELRDFCRPRQIPWIIRAEKADGTTRSTGLSDRKAIVIKRVHHYLRTGDPGQPTVFPHSAVSDRPLPTPPSPTDKIHYGQYNRNNTSLMDALKHLTDDKFADGAIARIELVDYWTAGVAPTLSEFAARWLKRNRAGYGVDKGEHPEAAYLTDLANGTAGHDWKAKRIKIAHRCLRTLDRIAPPPNSQ